jgi:phosphoribosyl-AMP cyclohydrolase
MDSSKIGGSSNIHVTEVKDATRDRTDTLFEANNKALDKVEGQKTRMTIFASSTFTDTKLERKILTSKILPKLQEKGRSAGIVVTIYDMRYGVNDDNLKQHLVWETCRHEIQRCFEESSGTFFLSLQGD